MTGNSFCRWLKRNSFCVWLTANTFCRLVTGKKYISMNQPKKRRGNLAKGLFHLASKILCKCVLQSFISNGPSTLLCEVLALEDFSYFCHATKRYSLKFVLEVHANKKTNISLEQNQKLKQKLRLYFSNKTTVQTLQRLDLNLAKMVAGPGKYQFQAINALWRCQRLSIFLSLGLIIRYTFANSL